MRNYWTAGHTGEDKKKRIAQVKGYKQAFKDLEEILRKHYVKKDNVRSYGEPGWEHRQIAANEYNAALEDLLELMKVD